MSESPEGDRALTPKMISMRRMNWRSIRSFQHHIRRMQWIRAPRVGERRVCDYFLVRGAFPVSGSRMIGLQPGLAGAVDFFA